MDPVKPAGASPVDLELGLLPEREGQPRIYTATGPVPEAGHWYSPAEVRKRLAAERERCADICAELAWMMEQGAGVVNEGERLRQAERDIRRGEPPSGWVTADKRSKA